MAKDLREELKAVMAEHKLSATAVACQTGLANSTVWNWMSGVRKETPFIRDAVEHFLRRARRGGLDAGGKVISIANGPRSARRRNAKQRPHYRTATVEKVAAAIDYCVENNALGLVAGDYGAGKTHAVQLWRAEHGDVESALVEFNVITAASRAECLNLLALSLGLAQGANPGHLSRCFAAVVDRLREEPVLLIFDQCEMVRVEVLQLIRQVWDQTRHDGVGVVLLASPQLIERMERGRAGDLGALRSRIGVWVTVPGLAREEMAAIVKSEGIAQIDEAALDLWFHAINGSMRYLMESIDLIQAKHAGKRVTEKTVEGVCRHLMGITVRPSRIRGRAQTGQEAEAAHHA